MLWGTHYHSLRASSLAVSSPESTSAPATALHSSSMLLNYRGNGRKRGKKKHLTIPDGFFMASVLCADEGCMDLFAS